ncbi:ABC transporter permease subunit [Kitasatospora aureofaciens]|uniref:ABC transporter permease n=1 Tax=Kitasatospora aureofaciens TaxID=1894 RepID=UPI001C4934D8|nr:ABC transporter permease subunit [Kitasatospora aureofaciens]MBV6702876.1 ABC transporter permease subunit [Kitasatospora aureofaciens]
MPVTDTTLTAPRPRPVAAVMSPSPAPTRTGARARGLLRRAMSMAAGPLLAVTAVLCLWQCAFALHLSATLPAPAAVGHDLAASWSSGVLAPALLHSLRRCLTGFLASAAIGVPMGLLLSTTAVLRTPIAPILSAIQALPAAALVPVAVMCMGNSESAVYAVVLLGAVPAIASGTLTSLDRIPPLLRRAGRSMGATGFGYVRHVLLPAALPGLVTALEQGWTFGWRALMTAELIAATPLPGIGHLLDDGRRSGRLSLVLAATAVILAIGVLVEAAAFAPVSRHVLRTRGLTTQA